MLAWLFSIQGLAALLTCFATLMIFSFLYRDNPFYKFAEHVFVGVASGYAFVLVWFQIIKPNLWEKLLVPEDDVRQALFREGRIAPGDYLTDEVSLFERLAHGEWVYFLFLVLGIMMLLKVSKKIHWISRWPLAYVIGAFAGIQIIQAAQGSLIPQLRATMKDFTGQGTVLQLLDQSGRLPDGELESRQEEVQRMLEEFLGDGLYPEQREAGVTELRADLSSRLMQVVRQDLYARQPRNALRQARIQVEALAAKDSAMQAILCRHWGGAPLEWSLAAATFGGSDEGALLVKEIAASGELPDYLERAFLRACANHVELAPWQDRLYTLLNRTWLETPETRRALALELDELFPESSLGSVFGATGAASLGEACAGALARPPERPSLTELFKSEAFPGDLQPDWRDPTTHQRVDSLLKQVNARPAKFGEWSVDQLRDLESRIAASEGADTWNPSLAADLELRFASLERLLGDQPDLTRIQRERIRDAAWRSWREGFLAEAGRLRRGLLERGLKVLTSVDLSQPFSEDQVRELRRDPERYLGGSAVGIGRGAMRGRMLVEILSNLLVVVGVCTGVFYFFFSKKHTGALGVASKVGIAFLMMSFGASFGYTVMGRISLAIGRFQDLMFYPWMAGAAMLILIAALVVQARKKTGE